MRETSVEGRKRSTVPEDESLARGGVDLDLFLVVHVELSLSAIEVTIEINDEGEEASLFLEAREASIVVGLEFSANLVCKFQRGEGQQMASKHDQIGVIFKDLRTLVETETLIESFGTIHGLPFVSIQLEFLIDKRSDTLLENSKRLV